MQMTTELVHLNIGGQYFCTRLETLLTQVPDDDDNLDAELVDTWFSKLLSGNFDIDRDEQGRIFIDRDGSNFKYILNYLRAKGNLEQCVIPFEKPIVMRELIIEADFYSLPALKSALSGKSSSAFLNSTLMNRSFVRTLKSWLPRDSEWIVQYRGRRDGFKAKDFHDRIDHKGETLTIIETDNGSVFGGYTPCVWSSSGSYKTDPNTFIFSLKTPNDDKATKMPFINVLGNHSIQDDPNSGPNFGLGKDIFINTNSNDNVGSYTNLGRSFSHVKATYGTTEAKKYMCGSYHFRVKEIEVFIRK
jgi:hypothetical protein